MLEKIASNYPLKVFNHWLLLRIRNRIRKLQGVQNLRTSKYQLCFYMAMWAVLILKNIWFKELKHKGFLKTLSLRLFQETNFEPLVACESCFLCVKVTNNTIPKATTNRVVKIVIHNFFNSLTSIPYI